MVSGWHLTSTITATIVDHLNNPVPDGTSVRLSTSAGIFPDASLAYTVSATAGQITTVLTLSPTARSAIITATVENVTATTSVRAIYPAVEVQVTPNKSPIYKGDAVTYTYRITNTGDVTLTAVMATDDNTSGYSGDDVTVCDGLTLAGTATNCSRSMILTQTVTNTVSWDKIHYTVSPRAFQRPSRYLRDCTVIVSRNH
jgi:uncharacterized repeat protein (TIGR01451 family)